MLVGVLTCSIIAYMYMYFKSYNIQTCGCTFVHVIHVHVQSSYAIIRYTKGRCYNCPVKRKRQMLR